VEKCVNCQYYDRHSARPSDGKAQVMWGQCRRHSPHLNPLGPSSKKAHMVEGVWPLVRDDDWCGEWRTPARVSVAPPRARLVPRAAEAAAPATTNSASPEAEQEPATEGSRVAGRA